MKTILGSAQRSMLSVYWARRFRNAQGPLRSFQREEAAALSLRTAVRVVCVSSPPSRLPNDERVWETILTRTEN